MGDHPRRSILRKGNYVAAQNLQCICLQILGASGWAGRGEEEHDTSMPGIAYTHNRSFKAG